MCKSKTVGDRLECPKCGGNSVKRNGHSKMGHQEVWCKSCGKYSVLVGFEGGWDWSCVCLNCGGDRVGIRHYSSAGFRYRCKGCGSYCVIERERLSCDIEEVVGLFRELTEFKTRNHVMRMLRGNIYANGELVIKGRVLVRYVIGFEGVVIPNTLVGRGIKLLKYLLRKVGMSLESFGVRSGMNKYLLRSLFRGHRKVNEVIGKEFEVATGIDRNIWLGRGLKDK